MTLPVPNQQSALVKVVDGLGKVIGKGFIVAPWNSWFQQFSQKAPAVAAVAVGVSPFSYTANANGTLIVTGGTVSNISLVRGSDTINFTGQLQIPISIGDTVIITYSVIPTVKFLGV